MTELLAICFSDYWPSYERTARNELAHL